MKKILSLIFVAALLMTQIFITAQADDKISQNISPLLLLNQETLFPQDQEKEIVFNVATESKYMLSIEYECIAGKSSSPLLSVAFDDQSVNSDDVKFTLPRVWSAKKTDSKTDRFDLDSDGNELSPSQEEKFEKKTIIIPFTTDNKVLLSAGKHTLMLLMNEGSVKIYKIEIFENENIPTYKEYLKSNAKQNSNNQYIRKEAEMVYEKGDLNIVTTFDRSLPSISPSSPDKIMYNILGGTSWSREGQWVSWNIDVKNSGYYNFDVVYRQNVLDGISVRRRIYIDDVVPFKEMDCVEFPYQKDFGVKTLSNAKNEPYKFYFEKGQHTITMEVVLGNAKSILSEFQDTISELNSIYSKINVIIGNQTDAYRDYDLDKSIPGLKDGLLKQAKRIDSVIEFLDGSSKSGGSQTARMKEMSRLLSNFAESPKKIPGQVDYFRSQINTMADVLASMLTQPLELDFFTLRSSDKETEKIDNGFLSYVSFRAKAFASTFVSDYNSKSNVDDKSGNLNVWVSSNDLLISGFSSGRDQSQIIDQMVKNKFSPENNISVKLSLINASDTLMQAVASGKGPDVVLLAPKTIIGNLYFRGALVDLTQMDGYNDIVSQYYPSSLISLSSEGKLYAFPEVQMFNMLFYRKDIFNQLDITPPKTWDEFYTDVFRIQNAGLQTGITESQLIFEMFLLQNGGTLYNDDLSATRLKEKISVDAFSSWTKLYAKYGFPLSFDMLNRFRTGQMPMAIAPYYFYSQVSVSAPEIENLWSIAEIPGTIGKDGAINRSESCSISGAIALTKKNNDYDNAFKFLKWWTSEETQSEYAFECETRVGISARYSPANKETMKKIAWTQDEYKSLSSQWENVSDMPQTPASYYVTRNLSNAYRRVVYDFENSRDVIYRYGQEIDNELTRKREELGLNKK